MIKISTPSYDLLLCLLYNPPKGSNYRYTLDDFSLIFETINSFKLPCVFCGDFNLPENKWSTCESQDQYESNVIYMFEENKFTQIVNFKTRAEYVLDLVFIRNCSPTVVEDHTFDAVFDVSNHKAVSISFVRNTYEIF